MTVVSFRKGSKHLWFIFLCPLAYFCRDLGFKINFANNFLDHPLIVTTIMFLGETLAGVYQLTSLCKTETKAYSITDTLKIKEQTNPTLKKKSKVILLVSLSATIDFISFTGITWLCKHSSIELYNIHTEMRITPIFFMSYLSNKLFHFEIYKHHKIAIIIVGIGYIFICIDRLFQLMFLKDNDFQLYFIPMFLVIHSINSIKQINDKYIMDKLYVSPFMLLLYQGIVGFCICIFSVSTISFFKLDKFTFIKHENFTDIVNIFGLDNVKNVILFYGILLVSGAFLNVFLMQTKKYYTPTHRSIADSLNAFCTWVYYSIVPKVDTSWTLVNIFDIIGYFLIINGCLLYNELIILHCFDLDRDIKENIVNRSQSDCMASVETIGEL